MWGHNFNYREFHSVTLLWRYRIYVGTYFVHLNWTTSEFTWVQSFLLLSFPTHSPLPIKPSGSLGGMCSDLISLSLYEHESGKFTSLFKMARENKSLFHILKWNWSQRRNPRTELNSTKRCIFERKWLILVRFFIHFRLSNEVVAIIPRAC